MAAQIIPFPKSARKAPPRELLLSLPTGVINAYPLILRRSARKVLLGETKPVVSKGERNA